MQEEHKRERERLAQDFLRNLNRDHEM